MNAAKREKVATIIVEAASLGDEAACKKHSIDVRTLQRYRKALPTDADLSELVATKKAKVEQGWADEIPGALREAIGFLRKAATEGDPKDPSMVHSIAGAFKLLSEQAATWKVLDARLARQNRPVQQEAGQATGGGTGTGRGPAGVVPLHGSDRVRGQTG